MEEILKIVGISGCIQVLASWLLKVWLNRVQEVDRRETAKIIEGLRNSLTKEREEYLAEKKQQYSLLSEWTSRRHQLRMAALERRLEAHQQAYALWWELRGAVYDEERLHKVVMECQDWWVKNCLYLDAKARQAFRTAYYAAPAHREFVKPPFDGDAAKEHMKLINDAGAAIVKGVALPSLSGEEEYRPINPAAIENG